MENKNVIIFRDRHLGFSEVFIKNQLMSLQRYSPYLFGSFNCNETDLAGIHTVTIDSLYKFSKPYKFLFKTFGLAPPRFTKKIILTKPLFVHAHFGADANTILPLTKKLKIPLITTFHGYDITINDPWKKQLHFTQQRFMENRTVVARTGTLFIAVSQFIKNKLIEKGFSEAKIMLHYIGINTDNFTPDRSIKRKNVILFVGGLREVKGCHFLLEAMNRIKNINSSIELYIVGKGSQEQQLRESAEKSRIKTTFFGALPQTKIRDLMNIAKVFCVPSTKLENGYEEAFGLVFLEAQSMGVPVVSFKTGGIPEAVVDGETGILVKDKDILGLANGCISFLESESMWNRYSQNGQTRVKKYFELKNQTDKLEEIYDKVIHNNLI